MVRTDFPDTSRIERQVYVTFRLILPNSFSKNDRKPSENGAAAQD